MSRLRVSDVFRRLSYGELSNIAMGMEGVGAIEASKQDRLIHYINEALLRLHSRFVLREEGLLVRLTAHVTNYHISSRYAESNTDRLPADPVYIMDTASPYRDDLIKITAVYDQSGMQIPLNDGEDRRSFFTPMPDCLQVPNPVEGYMIELGYQCRHPLIGPGQTDACIELTPALEGALTAYVAHMVYSFMNGADNAAKGQEHLARYEYICAEVERMDLVNSSISTTNTKFESRGFI